MTQDRLYFSELNPCPINVKDKTNQHMAYMFNLSEGGLCFVTPKYYDKKIGSISAHYDIGSELSLEMSPLRLGKVECNLKVLHTYEDENYRYYGGEFQNIKSQDKEGISKELAGVKKRKTIKKAPVKGALWLASATSVFYVLLTSFQI